MKSSDDRLTILAIKDGQIDRFESIVTKYTKIIRSYVYGKLFNKADVDDLVQNSFLSFYKAIHRFDVNRPVLPYLYEIAKNEMKMYFRSKKQTVGLHEGISSGDDHEKWGESEDITRILEKLSGIQKRVMTMIAEGYSYEDVADKLKKPLNTIRTIIRRARLKLTQDKKYE